MAKPTPKQKKKSQHVLQTLTTKPLVLKKPHRIKRPPRQYPLRRGIHAAPVPLQVPHDLPPPHLREHARDLLDVGRVGGSRVVGVVIRPRRGRGLGEEEVADCEGGEGGEEEEGRDGERLLLLMIWHFLAAAVGGGETGREGGTG